MDENKIKERYLEIIKTIASTAKPETYTLDQLCCAKQILLYYANTTHIKGTDNCFGMDEGWKVDYCPSSFIKGVSKNE